MSRAALLRNALFVIGAAISPGVADAHSLDHTALEQLFGEPVTDTVTGSPQRESLVPATMIIVTAEDIRRSGARDIPGILKYVAGVDVLQTSNDYADISLRGYSQAFSSRLLVLVDGRQVYADYYGFTPWSSVPVELGAIRQIEVVKGPNSALFGFNAVAGVINIVTFDPLDDPVNSALLAAGTQGLAEASVVSSWKLGESAGIRLTAGHREGDDFSTPLLPADVGARRGNERSAINLDIEWILSNDVRVGAEATYSDTRQAEFSPIYTLNYFAYESSSVSANAAADTNAGLLSASIYSNRINVESFIADSPEVWLEFDNQVTVAQLQSISKIANQHTLRLSAEYRHSTMETTPVSGGNVYYDVAAFAGMWEWQVDPSVTLTAAARVDHWSLGRSGSMPAGYPLTNDDWDRSKSEPSFNAGIVWQVSEADTLRFLVGRGVQLPNLVNLGGFLLPIPNVGFTSGVPDLEPTTVESYELSWDRSLSSLPVQLRISAFHGRSGDLVAIQATARPSEGLFGLPGNVGDSAMIGLEASIEGKLLDEWRWGVSIRSQEIDDEFTPGTAAAGTLIDFENTTPELVAKANLGWARDRWEVDGYLRYQSRFDGFVADPLNFGKGILEPISSYVALDGRVAYAVGDRMTFAISGQNLANSQQHQTSGPDVERTLYAMFTMSFGPRE